MVGAAWPEYMGLAPTRWSTSMRVELRSATAKFAIFATAGALTRHDVCRSPGGTSQTWSVAATGWRFGLGGHDVRVEIAFAGLCGAGDDLRRRHSPDVDNDVSVHVRDEGDHRRGEAAGQRRRLDHGRHRKPQ